ncbi:MAG: hypothetical protein ACK4N5_09715, partial [Myxococcales bacterium]
MRAPLRLVLLGSLLLACSMEASPLRAAECAVDADCGPGQVCFEDGCGSEVEVAVLVAPNAPELVTQDFNPVDVSGSRMELSLKGAALIQGKLQISTESGQTEYKAEPGLEGFTLTARGRSSNIP